jgi:hypothetical protein
MDPILQIRKTTSIKYTQHKFLRFADCTILHNIPATLLTMLFFKRPEAGSLDVASKSLSGNIMATKFDVKLVGGCWLSKIGFYSHFEIDSSYRRYFNNAPQIYCQSRQ